MTSTDASAVLAERKDHWEKRGATVTAVCRFVGVSTSELARRLGVPYTTIQNKLVGKAVIQAWELDAMAAALHLPVSVLEENGPDDAVRWLLDHPEQTRGCFGQSAPIIPNPRGNKRRQDPKQAPIRRGRNTRPPLRQRAA